MSDQTRRQLQAAIDRAAVAEEQAWVAYEAAKEAVSDALRVHAATRRAYEQATIRLREYDGD